MTSEQIAQIEALLRVLQAEGVRSCTINDMSFELGPVPPRKPVEPETPEQYAKRVQREYETLLYASAGG